MDSKQFEVMYEPGTPLASGGEEVEGADIEDGDEGIQGRDIPEFQQLGPVLVEEQAADKIVVGEVELTARSSVERLRQTARYLRVSASGSKQKIFQRIKEAHLTALKMSALEVARQEYEALDPKPRFADAPKQPSAMERKMHEVTHLPFRAWCSFCVQAKSRGNYKHRTPADESSSRSFPTVQVDLFAMPNSMGVLLMVDVWTKYIGVEPLRNKNAGVIGAIIARFLSNLSYFDTIEVSYDNEPVLAAGVKMAQVIRSNQGLPMVLQPGKMYSKSRTSLAERSIQTVRAQGKCLIAYIEDKMEMKLAEDHVLRGWAMVHAGWLLNRYHLTSSSGITAYMAVRGRPYKGRVCAFGEEVYALDSLQQKYQCQWRKGCWLTKDEADHDIVAVGENEIIRSKAVRKTAEHWDAAALLALQVGPWDMKRGTQTLLQPSKPAVHPVPVLHTSSHGVQAEHDPEGEAVLQYAKEHPDEDAEEEMDSHKGGALSNPADVPPHELQGETGGAVAFTDAEMDELIQATEKRDRETELKLPVGVRQRVAEAEASKRSTEKQSSSSAKFVKFDHTSTEQQKSKQQKTEMYSPTFAGEVSASPTSGSGHVRQVTEEIELYEEDEPEINIPLETWDWDVNDQLLDGEFAQFEISPEEKKRRGFHNEEAGPPNVCAEELARLDKQAMFTELERLRKLDVIGDVQEGVDVEQALHLDKACQRLEVSVWLLDKTCENGGQRISWTMCLNRRNIQPNNTADDGEGVDCHDVAERFDAVRIRRERCFSHGATTRRCGHCCTQLGESSRWKCKFDVLAATQMFARAKECSNEMELPSYHFAWRA